MRSHILSLFILPTLLILSSCEKGEVMLHYDDFIIDYYGGEIVIPVSSTGIHSVKITDHDRSWVSIYFGELMGIETKAGTIYQDDVRLWIEPNKSRSSRKAKIGITSYDKTKWVYVEQLGR